MTNATARTIYLAADHAGFEHKAAIAAWLVTEQYEVIDMGATTYDTGDDFPDFIMAAAAAVQRGSSDSHRDRRRRRGGRRGEGRGCAWE